MASIINASATGVGGVITTADASGVLQLQSNGTTSVEVTNSTFKFNSGYGSVATAYGCRAWVNFNGTGTVAIRASGNVTSITDNGTGDYTVNFTTAMPDANYTSVANSGLNSAATAYVICYTNARSTSPFTQAPTTTAMRFVIAKGVLSTDVTSDSEYLNVAVFR